MRRTPRTQQVARRAKNGRVRGAPRRATARYCALVVPGPFVRPDFIDTRRSKFIAGYRSRADILRRSAGRCTRRWREAFARYPRARRTRRVLIQVIERWDLLVRGKLEWRDRRTLFIRRPRQAEVGVF